MFKELDPILHSQLRLAVMSLLIGIKEAEFTFIKEKQKYEKEKRREIKNRNQQLLLFAFLI